MEKKQIFSKQILRLKTWQIVLIYFELIAIGIGLLFLAKKFFN